MIGQTVSHYRILDKLGEGGMGVAYKAHDTNLDRIVALKFLTVQTTVNDENQQRFLQEARAVAQLNHPNVCNVYSIEEFEDIRFIVMEYIDGATLSDKLQPKTPLNISAAIEYAIQIVKGLKAAHDKKIIHRDIKSNNIMVTGSGEIKLLDFGLAKLPGTSLATKTGATIGTVVYMSPEQVRGEHIDERSDIWSVGVVLYEMVTGHTPFEGDYEHAVMYSIVNTEPSSIANQNKDVPEELEHIVSRCLTKEKSKRYQSTSELLDDLIDVRDRSKTGTSVSKTYVKRSILQPKPNRHRHVVYGIALFIVVLIFVYMFLATPFTVQRWVTTTPGSIQLMVLPFTNIGDDPGRQVFCDGLVETVTSNLTQMERFHSELWVVPAGEVRNHDITSVRDAHKIFGVNYVVTGSLQQIAGRLRLTINLVDPKNLRQLQSSVIDVDGSDILGLHNGSVEKLMAMINMEFNPEKREVIKAGNTSVSPAFELYLNGIGNLQRYEMLENINAAIESFTQSVELDPQFTLAYAGLGQAYWRKYEYTKDPLWVERANEQCRIALSLDDQLEQVNITVGIINTGTGQYEKAIENFNKVLAANPASADAYRGLAKAYELVGDLAKAESMIKRAIQLKPDYWAGYNLLGVFYSRNNQYEKAIEQFEKVLELTPDNYRGYMNLGSMYYFLEQWDMARTMYERSLELEKTYSAASNLGTVYYIEGRYSEAARVYETALEISDGDYLLWGNLGSAYYWIPGQREKARSAYKRAIELAEERNEINPNDPEVIINLAGYRAMTGDEEQARIYLQRAIDMAPGNTWVMFVAGTTFERLGDREQALHFIGSALEHGYSRSEILNQPELQRLIADERFKEVLRDYHQ